MDIELLPGLSNVVRFPLERRAAPSMELVAAIEPDAREVLRLGESFFLALPEHDLRERVDAETARYVAEHVLPLAPSERGPALDELLRPVLARAVAACRHAEQVSQQASEAQQRLLELRTEHGAWDGPFQRHADGLLQQAAELLLLAYRRCQEAHGVDRAVGMARRDEAWTPDSTESATEWLIAAAAADRARRVPSRTYPPLPFH